MARPGHKKSFRKREPKEFEEEVMQIARVTRVVKGGRKLRFRATVAIGNRKGKVGVGVGKSQEVTGAIQKAIAQAKKVLTTVTLDGTTIPHDLKIKLKSSKIVFLPAAPGTGVIAGGPIRKVLELAGVKDILSKSYGTTNKLNNTKATFEALKMFRETPFMEKRQMKKKAAKEANKPTPKKEDPKAEKKAEKSTIKEPATKKEEVKKEETTNKTE